MMQAGAEAAVQQVCQAMRTALANASQQSYLRPLLTSHMLLGDHEAALLLIKQVRPPSMVADDVTQCEFLWSTTTGGRNGH